MQIADAGFPYLSAILVSCLAGLLLIVAIPEERKALIRRVSAVFSGITLVLSVIVFCAYDKSQGGLQFVEKVMWIPSLGIQYFNAADGFNLPNLLLTGIVFFTGVLTMWELETRVKEYYALYFLLVLGVFGLFMSMDLFFIFVWYDVSLFPMYLLIAVWGHTRKEYGAMKLTLYLLAGSALILPAIVYLFTRSGLNTFDVVALMQPGVFSADVQKFAFPLLYLGFGILAGVWPFHTWSPVGHVAAPTGVSMVHAGVLMKIGAFGILRVGIFLCPLGWQYWAQLMALLAAVGIIYGALVGLRQTDLKYVIGYSSVSHMGVVGLGLSTVSVDGLNGAVFQMFSHGIMTALLFSSVGYIYDRTHTKMIPELGGLSRIMPVASAYFILAALAGMGVPGLANFWGELVVFIAAVKVYPVRGIVAVLALVVTALFMLRVVQKTFYGPENERHAHLPDVSFGLGVPRMILAFVLVLFGLYPALMFDVIQTASIPFMNGLPK
ncbi:complex I subunit 4 family protein [Syntrophobacter fumaroxidans]|uniref:Proton-translocating NADH-quinone oxidoreductase, chain M n=1 Tax=Syntrophobacter fumaroxidans (strain DSM 10017 / MPOB) TaxID=335543 RepID=A0LJL9_SYNFM|nr:NADH-quinone oxidoreductase subunit M [Syntrophobacter fumaroxidans]ABK17621.1 proton-translocating NADH-quinone oxidoreductase, chain M [Syntrophobacter fumaroxidans MPOB]